MNVKDIFHPLSDSRSEINKSYPFEYLMLVSICAIMSGEGSFSGMADYAKINKDFFKKYFALKDDQTPSHDTFNRLYNSFEPEKFNSWFMEFTKSIAEYCSTKKDTDKVKHIAVDGKTLRNSGERPFHIVNAWCSKNNLILSQKKVSDKSNEIKAIPILLEMLDIKNSIITIDAMGCQREICQQIVSQGGDYIIAVKGNQKNMFEDIQEYFHSIKEFSHKKIEHNDKGHGRIEQRICRCTDDIEWLREEYNWPGLKSIVQVKSTVHKKGKGKRKESKMTRYFVSSIKGNPAFHLSVIRDHWGVENSLHWVLDCTFNEDKSCIRRENAALNTSTARKISINILNSSKDKDESLRYMQRKCWNPAIPIQLLQKFNYAQKIKYA